MTLCRNRVEGFGPHSDLHPGLPTTCFLDVIVEPLPTWIFLVLMLALLPLRIRQRRNASRKVTEYGAPPKGDARPGVLARILTVLYYFLIAAILAMVSLEIARLAQAEQGIGLLPFIYVGVLVALANRLTWKSRIARLANFLFWIMMTVVFALKVAAEQYIQMSPERRVKDVGVEGNYPTSDEALDNAVMVGVVFLLALFELIDLRNVPGRS